MHARNLVSVLTLTFVLPALANAALIVSHTGAIDPLNEGWLASGSWGANNVLVGSVYNDAGHDAWMVDDNIVNSGTARGYLYNQTAQDIADGQALGWQLDFTVRSVDKPDSQDLAVAIEIGDDVRRWGSAIYLDGAGNTELWLQTGSLFGPAVTIAGEGYHDYSMIYDPLDQMVDVLVDNLLVYSDWAGNSDIGSQRVVWGSNQSAATGQGNWAAVSLNILEPVETGVPMPASWLLLGPLSLWVARRGASLPRNPG